MARTRKRAPAGRRAETDETPPAELRRNETSENTKRAPAHSRRRGRGRGKPEAVDAEARAVASTDVHPPAPAAPVAPPAQRAAAGASPPADDGGFGAGIFDDEPAGAAPASPTAGHGLEEAAALPDMFDSIGETAPPGDRPSALGDSADPAGLDAAQEAAHRHDRSGTGRRDRRTRKSRKQRLEEEAEVIAALRREREGQSARSGAPGMAAPELTAASAPVSEAAAEHFEEFVSEVFDPQTGSLREDAGSADSAVLEHPAELADERTDEARPGAAGEPGDERRGRRRRRRRRSGALRDEAPPQADVDEIASEDLDDRAAAGVVFDLDGEGFDEMHVDEGDAEEEEAPRPASGERHEMLINVADAEECRIAILRSGRLDELYIERASSSSNVGNIYKGRVTNVEPSIQAAFVDFGLPMHGFLHISDLHPQYFPDSKGEPEQVGKKTPRKHRPPIQNCLRRGQEVIVQVIKEGIGTKGPTLSTYISIPGRFLVMMPGMDQLGVSRKIDDDDKRRKMRDILAQLSLPKNMGFIVRTAGVDRPKRDLQRDLNYLSRLWKKVALRIKKEPAPAAIYKESDLVIRTIRDVFDSNLQRIIVDSPVVAGRVREFLAIASPRTHDVVEVYEGREPLFHKYGIEAEIERLHSKYVPLPCGGSLVIESTEAMVAIDVNSGRFRVHDDAEETAYRVNLEAVEEIARQLRLRDLGGLIVCDLIDMTSDRHRRVVAKTLNDALKKHKERAKILPISRFGLLELTRQRQGPSLFKTLFRECPRCAGSGRVKAPESVTLDLMRQIRIAGHQEGVARIDVRASMAVANDLLNRKRIQLADIERAGGQTICINGVEDFLVDQFELTCTDRRGREVFSSRSGVRQVEQPRPTYSHPSRPMPPREGGRNGGGTPHGGQRRQNDGRGRRRGGRRRRR